MSKRQIKLTVTFKAEYVSDEVDVEMAEASEVQETTTLTIPQLDDKYVVFPKVLEGVTTQVIEAHNRRVNKVLDDRIRQEIAEREQAKMLAFPNGNGTYN